MKYVLAIALLASSLVAQAEWSGVEVTDSGNAVYSTTESDDGSELGYLCGTDVGSMCYLLVGMDVTCNEGGKLLGMLSTDGGVAHVSFECMSVEENGNHYYKMYSSNEDVSMETIRDELMTAKVASVAVALVNNAFTAYRFDLTGSSRAIKTVTQLAVDMEKGKLAKQNTGYSQPVESGRF